VKTAGLPLVPKSSPQSIQEESIRGCIVYRYAGTGLPYLIVHKADSIGSQS
jgi:hypothetical protein